MTGGDAQPAVAAATDIVEIDLLGRRVCVLDISRELSPTIPIYPGHVGVAFWDHLTHEQVKLQRVDPDSSFRGYAVRGMVASEHVSTHVDAIWHFNPDRPDLTIDKVGFDQLITPAAWIDVSDVAPRTYITVDRLRSALDEAGVELRPGMTLLYYTGVSELWQEPLRFTAEYPGLDREASIWLLDQGLVNVATDAPSTDHPGDPGYPNHTVHAERLVIHTEMVANMTRIPRHSGFWTAFFPLKLEGGTGSPARAIALWPAD
jgi:kynurenine formamidase